jgi:hypothetical protein
MSCCVLVSVVQRAISLGASGSTATVTETAAGTSSVAGRSAPGTRRSASPGAVEQQPAGVDATAGTAQPFFAGEAQQGRVELRFAKAAQGAAMGSSNEQARRAATLRSRCIERSV